MTTSEGELCDVFDDMGVSTGQTVVRGTTLRAGEYYLVVQVWIRNAFGQYLIQQRAPHLLSGAGMWATTAGQVLAGETSLAGAVREVQEELGLTLPPALCQRFDRLKMGDLMQDIWLVEIGDLALGEPKLGIEVTAWQWASKHQIAQMIQQGQFFAYSYFARLPA